MRSADESGKRYGPFEVPFEPAALLAAAREGGFFSYVAGVAYVMLTNHRVGGLEIDNYATTLPLKKGLSSSAAICVLTARAFNRVYNLRLTVRGEMEAAFQGELMTPSRCGRMDQACAFGSRPVELTYDGDFVSTTELQVPKPLYYVVVDLCAKKDTVTILRDLQSAYPVPGNSVEMDVHSVLGELNLSITARAKEAFAKADARTLGELMKEAQDNFDRAGSAVCPSQLTAPVLHRVLNYPALQDLVWGGKGIGAGGDGAAQFLCKGFEAQTAVAEVITRDLGMFALKLTIEAASTIRKAVIPAAGFGVDLFPATKATHAPLFPIVDRDGSMKPAILVTVTELVEAGLERVVIVVQPGDVDAYRRLFKEPLDPQNYHKLKPEQQKLAKEILLIGEKVELVVQEKQEGFGHAVLCAHEVIGDEAFLLVLGDHLCKSLAVFFVLPKSYLQLLTNPMNCVDRSTASDGRSCVQQLLDAYALHCGAGSGLVGVRPTPLAQVPHFGTVSGTWLPDSSSTSSSTHSRVLKVTRLAEKPSVEVAEATMKVPDLGDRFLTAFGMYVVPSQAFRLIRKQIDHNLRDGSGSVAFAHTLDALMEEVGLLALNMEAQRFDIGTVEHFLDSVRAFAGGAVDPSSSI